MAADPDVVAFRGRIIGSHEGGQSNRAIAPILGISPTTVSKWIERHQDGQPLTDLPRSGRPRCTNMEEDLQIVNQAIISPMTKRGAAGISKEVSKLFVLF